MTDLDSSALKFWEFVAEFGFILVIIGVAGESADLIAKWFVRCRKKPLPEKIERLVLPAETIFFGLLVFGLAVEFMGTRNAQRIADSDNAKLAVLAAEATERAANTESNNLVLQAQSAIVQSNMFVLFTKNEQSSNMARLLAQQTSNSLYNLRMLPNGGIILRPAQ